MNKKALFYGLLYSALVIAFKLWLVLSGRSVERFYFHFAHFLTVLFILPFYVICILSVRRDLGGWIGGRDAMKLALTIFAVGAVTTSIYNYFEFTQNGKDLAIAYYNSEDYLNNYLRTLKTVKPEEYPKLIAEQIEVAKTSAFKATTGKLFSLMLIGISGSVIVASILRRKPAAV
ncbi:MAG: DUF4199 domain-containing protein [Bacteroidia bacterium]|nr:DUF4199 domain-containing protein [Bacteroidia bacterium]